MSVSSALVAPIGGAIAERLLASPLASPAVGDPALELDEARSRAVALSTVSPLVVLACTAAVGFVVVGAALPRRRKHLPAGPVST